LPCRGENHTGIIRTGINKDYGLPGTPDDNKESLKGL
jgi:hypothetical protein